MDLPSRVRSDHGMENHLVGMYMIENRGTDRGSIITGSSVHNSRVVVYFLTVHVKLFHRF